MAAHVLCQPLQSLQQLTSRAIVPHYILQVVYNTLLAATRGKKGERPTDGADPHDNTIEDTLSQDQLLRLAQTMLASSDFFSHETWLRCCGWA